MKRQKTSNSLEYPLLLDALGPVSRVASKKALEIVERVSADQLSIKWDLDKIMAYTSCEVEDSVNPTIGTQCFIYLFDPGNGWIRYSGKIGDMLIMAAKLLAKGASFDGLSYYNRSIEQTIQDLISDRFSDPPATLNTDIVEIFTANNYTFSYPDPYASHVSYIQRVLSGELANEVTQSTGIVNDIANIVVEYSIWTKPTVNSSSANHVPEPSAQLP